MKAFSLRELATRLVMLLRQLRGLPAPSETEVQRRLEELARQGRVTLAKTSHPHVFSPLPRSAPDGTAEQLINEDRGR